MRNHIFPGPAGCRPDRRQQPVSGPTDFSRCRTAPHTREPGVVGMNLGSKDFAVLPEAGERLRLPASRKLKASLRRPKRLQGILWRKEKGSNRHRIARQKVARLHLRVADQRQAMPDATRGERPCRQAKHGSLPGRSDLADRRPGIPTIAGLGGIPLESAGGKGRPRAGPSPPVNSRDRVDRSGSAPRPPTTAPRPAGRRRGGSVAARRSGRLRDASHAAFDVRDRARSLAGDEFQAAQQLDPRAARLHVAVREHAPEDPAGVRETDQGRVARLGNAVGEQRALETHRDVLLHPAVDDGSAHPAEGAVEAALGKARDAEPDEAQRRRLAGDLRLPSRQRRDPAARVHGLSLPDDPRQHTVGHEIGGRGRVDDKQGLGVGVDPAGEGKVHEHRTRDGAVEGGPGDRKGGGIINPREEEHDLLGEAQHGGSIPFRSRH
ncbi:MAG: transposase [Boseongicola sp. SB0675_bin_26]|nr:transposase [Boseongicola sp. SB0675_bin_26]